MLFVDADASSNSGPSRTIIVSVVVAIVVVAAIIVLVVVVLKRRRRSHRLVIVKTGNFKWHLKDGESLTFFLL